MRNLRHVPHVLVRALGTLVVASSLNGCFGSNTGTGGGALSTGNNNGGALRAAASAPAAAGAPSSNFSGLVGGNVESSLIRLSWMDTYNFANSEANGIRTGTTSGVLGGGGTGGVYVPPAESIQCQSADATVLPGESANFAFAINNIYGKDLVVFARTNNSSNIVLGSFQVIPSANRIDIHFVAADGLPAGGNYGISFLVSAGGAIQDACELAVNVPAAEEPQVPAQPTAPPSIPESTQVAEEPAAPSAAPTEVVVVPTEVVAPPTEVAAEPTVAPTEVVVIPPAEEPPREPAVEPTQVVDNGDDVEDGGEEVAEEPQVPADVPTQVAEQPPAAPTEVVVAPTAAPVIPAVPAVIACVNSGANAVQLNAGATGFVRFSQIGGVETAVKVKAPSLKVKRPPKGDMGRSRFYLDPAQQLVIELRAPKVIRHAKTVMVQLYSKHAHELLAECPVALVPGYLENGEVKNPPQLANCSEGDATRLPVSANAQKALDSFDFGTWPVTTADVAVDAKLEAKLGKVKKMGAYVLRFEGGTQPRDQVDVLVTAKDKRRAVKCLLQIQGSGQFASVDEGNGEEHYDVRGLVAFVRDTDKNESKLMPDAKIAERAPFTRLTLSNLNVPTRAFEEGFPGVGVVEWFQVSIGGLPALLSDEAGRLVRETHKAYLSFPSRGLYSLSTDSDDGSRVWIGGKLVIDNDGLHAPTFKAADYEAVEAGKKDLRIEYYQGPRYHIQLVKSWEPKKLPNAQGVLAECKKLTAAELKANGFSACGRQVIAPEFYSASVIREVVQDNAANRSVAGQNNGKAPALNNLLTAIGVLLKK